MNSLIFLSLNGDFAFDVFTVAFWDEKEEKCLRLPFRHSEKRPDMYALESVIEHFTAH